MGHRTLADKLDQIQKEDLGIHFDESLLWEDLSAQLGHKKTAFIERRLLIAACITLLILLFPIVLMMDAEPQQLISAQLGTKEIISPEGSIAEVQTIIDESDSKESINIIKKTKIYSIDKKGVVLALAGNESLGVINLKPMRIQKEEKIERQLFADQDISIIQANLGTPSIEKEKSVTLRAQLHTSSEPVQLYNQALKIKLFEKSNQ